VPKYTNHCKHDKESFIKTIEVIEKVNGEWKENKYDVYVFNDKTFGPEVCIRYGNEPSEYMSPGPLLDFAKRAHGLEVYERAFQAIRKNGIITYTKR